MNAYIKVNAEHTGNHTHGETWVELESGDYMRRIGNDEIAEMIVAGEIWGFYIPSEDGEIIAKPFENLGLFGSEAQPPMRFTKANIAFVPAE